MEKNRKEKNQNIQVFVRLRPLNQREHDIRSLGVVEVCSSREVLVRNIQNNISKKFTFDRAFGPNSKQVDVHQTVVSPLIEEVLAGYNCTVFAYGQTGTGKTHTMVGESSDHKGSRQNDPMAGIIPRSLGQLFDELRLSNSEFTVRVSYLELYNEELFDLLAPIGSGDTKLKMYESSKGSSEVKGLEELLVRSKDEVYQILAQGQERRRIASTLMNAQSSRSHTVFTIVVRMNMKEPTADGEELVKTGKLNLVDLAGSENISKAGSDNPGKGDRKRECVVINQSLLTLGRVITSLVERHPHIPYRESKLTRLLQESLGGRTKTSIIATISPGHKDLEETLSTLEYAHRARNIQNKPEINQRVLKTQMMCEMVEDLDRLKRDLYATREQKGIYYSPESHAEVQLQLANQKKEIQDQILQIKAMKEEAERLEGGLRERVEALHAAEARLETMECTYRRTQDQLRDAENNLSKVAEQCEEQRHLVDVHSETEERLGREAREVRDAADLASAHADCLHSTVAKRRKLEQDNLEATRSYGAAASGRRARLRQHLDVATDSLGSDLAAVSDALESHVADCLNRQEESKQQLDCLMAQMNSAITEVTSSVTSAQTELSTKTREHQDALQSKLREQGESAAARLRNAARTLADCLELMRQRQQGAVDEIRSTVEQWSSSAKSRLQELQQQHESWHRQWSELERCAEQRASAEAARRREAARALMQALLDEQKETAVAKERLQREMDSIWTKRQTLYADMIARARTDDELASLEEGGAATERGAVRECVDGYRERLAAGMAAAGGEMVELNRGVLATVAGTHERVAADVDGARETVEAEMAAAAEAAQKASEVLSQESAVLLGDSQQCGEQTLVSTLTNIQKYYKTSSASVTSLCEDVGRQWSGDAASSRQRAGDVRAAGGAVTALREELRAELLALDGLEETFLNDEYESYSPTGQTPARTQYRYPHTFTATSPHERILARFRAQRTKGSDDECIELLDDSRESGAQASDADSSALSTDSATVFVQPLRPLETPTNKLPPIHKSTSESDLFSKKKNQKENQPQILSNASSLQKLSKLRQPSSLKKVLTQKN